MTLEQLRIFVAVAEREHVTQAARDLRLTQSATSAAVAALEARYATKLFDRVGRRILLTEAGRLFLIEAKAVLARAAAAENVLLDLADLKRGSLSLAASQTVANYWLPGVIERFRSLHPGVSISLTIGNTQSVASQVHDGQADLGFAEGTIDDPALSMIAVAQDEMILVVPAGHPWVSKPPRTPNDLRACPWVLREAGSGTRAILEDALRGLGLNPAHIDVALELPSNESVRAAVEAGAGVTIVSRLVVSSSIKAGSLLAVELALPRRSFSMLHHKERYITKAVRAFMSVAASL